MNTAIRAQNKPIDIYLISSTLHFFWAFMLAQKNRSSRESHLIAIDQYANKPLIMMNYLKGGISPFVTYETLAGREFKGLDKIQNRRHQFEKLRKLAQSMPVDRVFIGNDRSVIGQFFIKECKQQRPDVCACFMDDGVYSYLGREASKNWSERVIDKTFKKFAYGFWYDNPKTVGASKWIDEVWVMYPKMVNSALAAKQVVEILPNNHGFADLMVLSDKLFLGVGLKPETLAEVDVLITLPNETVFSKIEGYQSSMRLLVSSLVSMGKNVAIKYHPSAGKKDPLNLEKLGALKLPSHISFELFIPFLYESLLIGDFSTTVLTAQYSGKLSVLMLESKQEQSTAMRELCESLEIKVTKLSTFSKDPLIEFDK